MLMINIIAMQAMLVYENLLQLVKVFLADRLQKRTECANNLLRGFFLLLRIVVKIFFKPCANYASCKLYTEAPTII